MSAFLAMSNGQAVPIGMVPSLDAAGFRGEVIESVARGMRLSALFGLPSNGGTTLYAVLARDGDGVLGALSTRVGGEFEALTPECPQAHLFEREIAEQCGIVPRGHPWLKPVRFPPGSPSACGDIAFFRVEGEEVHEVAVGPVHAGVIEPGHFRFQCHGETVHHLEISLGYQHRGVERALVGGPTPRTARYIETLAGDCSVAHATAYARAIEAMASCVVPVRAQAIRGIALELERVANHVGDLGALAGDVGFLPTQSYCGRIRGDVLNLTALICGNRFGRGLVRPGGAGFDLEPELRDRLLDRIEGVAKDAASAIELLWESPSVLSRFEGAGVVTEEQAREAGLVGVAARACGLDRDVRHDFSYGIFRFAYIPVSTWTGGDVFARAFVRWLEIQRSIAFVRERIESLVEGPLLAQAGPLRPNTFVACLGEGWRGEVCHVAFTGGDGTLAAYKVVDASFHNWIGLALAMRRGQISDFPLCNKSFNLSYCGHDL